MSTPDIINGCFEFGAAGFSLTNIRRLWKDKKLSGISWTPTAFFTFWGLFNLYYYTFLNQPFSWFAGLSMTLVNIAWLSLLAYLEWQKRQW